MLQKEFTDDELYHAWIAHQQNGARAAKSIGMEAAAFNARVRRKNFADRYEVEYGDAARSVHKMALVSMANKLPRVLDELFSIIINHDRDEDGKPEVPYRDKVAAIRTYFDHLPPLPVTGTAQPMTYVEAKAVLVDKDDEPMTEEEQLRNKIQDNIVFSIEQRSGKV